MAVSPGTYNFTVQRRADHSVTLQFKDSNDAAINLTGWTVAAQAWDRTRTTKHADLSYIYNHCSPRTCCQLHIAPLQASYLLLESVLGISEQRHLPSPARCMVMQQLGHHLSAGTTATTLPEEI